MRREVVQAALAAALVGVGEAAHGELVSWPVRLALLRAATTPAARRPVYVFVECLHPLVAAMNVPGPFAEDGGRFYPCLIPYANMSAQHLALHRRLRAMAARGEVRFVGIDVQVATAHLAPFWERMPGGEPALDALVRRVVQKHGRGFTLGDGADRNRRNARIIAELMRTLTPAAAAAGPCFYWAHNAHVARGGQETRADASYRLEGWYLARALGAGRYLSVLTYAPVLWAMWGRSPREGPKRFLEPSPRTRALFAAGPRTLRLHLHPALPEGTVVSDYFRQGDADWLITVPEAPRLRPL